MRLPVRFGCPGGSLNDATVDGFFRAVHNLAPIERCPIVRLRYIFNDIEKIFDEPREAVVFGRRRHGIHVDIDLTPDLSVSRPHARIWQEDGRYWVEDLGSANGTTIDDKPIPPRTKFELFPGQTVGISHTRITVEMPAAAGMPHGLWSQDETIAAGRHDLVSLTEIGAVIDASAPAFDAAHPID